MHGLWFSGFADAASDASTEIVHAIRFFRFAAGRVVHAPTAAFHARTRRRRRCRQPRFMAKARVGSEVSRSTRRDFWNVRSTAA